MRHSPHALPLAALLACTACISLPAARSAETRPGPTVELSNSVAFAPGGTSRCVLSKPFFECSELLVGGSVGMTYGWIHELRRAHRVARRCVVRQCCRGGPLQPASALSLARSRAPSHRLPLPTRRKAGRIG